MNDRKILIDQINEAFIDEGGWYGIEVPEGWYDLVIRTHDKIVAIDPAYKIHQVKEKFGGLRYYCTSEFDEAISEIIRNAEKQSYNICQSCGSTENVNRWGPDYEWIQTLCIYCLAQQKMSQANSKYYNLLQSLEE